MSLSDSGRAVINSVFSTFVRYAQQLLNTYQWKVPGWMSMFITPSTVNWVLNYAQSGIRYIPDNVAMEVLNNVHALMEDIDDAYVRSVMHKKPDKSLAEILQNQGELVWSGV